MSEALGAVPLSRAARVALDYSAGWLALGLTAEAAAELDGIAPTERDALPIRRRRAEIALAAHDWAAAAAAWDALRILAPEDPETWINAAYALRRHAGIPAARAVLLAARERHPREGTIHFNLACYAAQLGELAVARDHLVDACRIAPGFRAMAREDPDLEPLRVADGL